MNHWRALSIVYFILFANVRTVIVRVTCDRVILIYREKVSGFIKIFTEFVCIVIPLCFVWI